MESRERCRERRVVAGRWVVRGAPWRMRRTVRSGVLRRRVRRVARMVGCFGRGGGVLVEGALRMLGVLLGISYDYF